MSIYINTISAPCGAGKSYSIRREILSGKNLFRKHLITVPTHKLIDDYVEAFASAGPKPGLLRSFRHREGRSETVADAINAERQRCEHEGHVVFIITHDALLRSVDHASFAGWSLWIDEVITLRNHSLHNSPEAGSKLADLYDLLPVCDGDRQIRSLRQIVAKSDVPVARLRDDSLLNGLADLHYRVVNGRETVMTNVRDWSDLSERPGWFAYSLFDVARLKHFAAIRMYANAIEATVTYKLLSRNIDVTLNALPFLPFAIWKRRDVRINYFADHHVLSQSALDKFATANVRLIQDWCTDQPWCSDDGHFWATNEKAELALPGQRASPISHGLNSYKGRSAVTAIYKAKPDNRERAMCKITGIDEATLIAERELETINQIVMRGSIRDPDSTAPYIITVYDHVQADHLCAALSASYGMTPIVSKVELAGFADPVMDRRPVRKPVYRTALEQAALRSDRKYRAAELRRVARWQASGKNVGVEEQRWADRRARRVSA